MKTTKSFSPRHLQWLLVAMLTLVSVTASAKLEGDWTSTKHVTWSAPDFSRILDFKEMTLSKDGEPVTVDLSAVKTSSTYITKNRIFVFDFASTIYVKAKKGYRIRRVILEDTELSGTNYKRDKATSRIPRWSDNRYKVDWKFASGSWQDNNNIIVDCYDAPTDNIKLTVAKRVQFFKARRISVEYVEDPAIRLKKKEYTVTVGAFTTHINQIYQGGKKKIDESLDVEFSFSDDAPFYVKNSYKSDGSFSLGGNRPGNSTMKVVAKANDDYARGEATANLKLRRDCNAQIGNNAAECNVKTYKPAEIIDLHKDYDGKITYKSKTSGIEVNPDDGKLTKVTVNGGWNGTLEIEINLPETNNFFGKKLTQKYSYFNNTYPLETMDDVFSIYLQVNEKDNKKMTIDQRNDIQVARHTYRISGYQGTFNGNGHKINVSDKHGGMFSSVDGATFNNIRLEGQIIISEGKDDYFVGLVDSIKGKTTFKNCQSNVNLLLYEGTCKTMAGFAAYGCPGSTAIFEDCGVNSYYVGEATKAAGFLGETDGKAEFVNCVFTGEVFRLKNNDDTTSKATFVNVKDEDKAVFINCYYANPLGQLQGDSATKKDIATGKLAYMLGEGKTWNNLPIWGQDLSDGNSVPQVMFDKEVFGVTFTYKDEPLVTRYVNKGMKVTDPPAAEQYRDEKFKDIKVSDLIFGDGFDPYATIIENSMTVPVDLNGELTGINGVKADGKDAVRQYYTLQGKYVGKSLDGMPKGVYICNGKKNGKKVIKK